MYGMPTFGDAFTPRQLTALSAFSDLVQEARGRAVADAKAAGMADDGRPLCEGGDGATAYGDAVAVYLAFAVDKCSNLGSSITSWMSDRGAFRETFARQAIPMAWDYAEANIFSESGGNFITPLDKISESIAFFPIGCSQAYCNQVAAQSQVLSQNKVVSTDPPYYDNIGYADLSDFFYVWLRRNLREIYPELFSTIATPKEEELIASPYRHGGKEEAERFFLEGMTAAMRNLAAQAHPAFPVTIYYAFKSSETNEAGTSNAGWETFLEAVLRAGFAIAGTWPMRTEGAGRLIANGTNALASSIVLVCRRRPEGAPEIERRDFLAELHETMPGALADMVGAEGLSSPIAPVDLAQAAIGPGMEIFSKYQQVLKADGSPMSVHEAMLEINKEIDDFLKLPPFDPITKFCLEWFDGYGVAQGPYGEAQTLAQAKGTTVERVAASGVVNSGQGKVRLIPWEEYPEAYAPGADNIVSTWELTHHLVRALDREGETAAGAMLAQVPAEAENIRSLCYYLYTFCERKNLAEAATAYNALMTSWHAVMLASAEAASRQGGGGLFGDDA